MHWRLLPIDRSSLAQRSVFEISRLWKLNSVHQVPDAEILPHVYTSASMTSNNVLSSSRTKYILPIGTERKYFEVGIFASSQQRMLTYKQDHEEVIIPPAKVVPPRISERLIPCSELPPLAKQSFLVGAVPRS
jgi:antiviral helicase SLH1